jgi:hypothetical protein
MRPLRSSHGAAVHLISSAAYAAHTWKSCCDLVKFGRQYDTQLAHVWNFCIWCVHCRLHTLILGMKVAIGECVHCDRALNGSTSMVLGGMSAMHPAFAVIWDAWGLTLLTTAYGAGCL